MELVTFNQAAQILTTTIATKRKRKPGAGRKQLYTSKCVTYATSMPSEALDELKVFVTALKAKYKK